MAKGKLPDFRVLVSCDNRDNNGKNYYTEVGSAWRVAKDGISIQLNALPVDGKLVLFPREAEEEGR